MGKMFGSLQVVSDFDFTITCSEKLLLLKLY